MAETRVGGDVKGALAIAVLLTLVAVAVGEEMFSWLVAVIVVPLVIFVLIRAPIRYSMMGLMFVSLSIENPDEHPAEGLYKSPFFGLGGLLLTHIKWILNVPGLGSLSCVDMMLIILLVVAFARKMSGSTIDRVGGVETPKPLIQLSLVSLAGIVWVLLVGMVRGGDMSMAIWQIDKVIHLPVIFLLFQLGLRGPKDHVALARVVLGAAVIKALTAVYINATVVVPPENGNEGVLHWATSHNDSILFACAFVILVSLMMERAGKKAVRLALMILPILAAGMMANHRRMVWVQVAAVFLTLYFATPANPAKRKIKIAALALSPLILTYIAMGWDSKDSIFKPVATIRSVVDPQADPSTFWREIENYDILFTIKQYWLVGTGYGLGYWEIMPLPAIDYSLEKYLPHNSILGLWFYAGFIGYTAFTLLWGAGVWFAIRSYHASKKPTDRVAALACTGSVLIYMVQCWGDVGLGAWTGVFIVGAALAVAGKLAVSVGVWPSKKAVKKPAPAPVTATVEGQVA
jgi:hypothetical protein